MQRRIGMTELVIYLLLVLLYFSIVYFVAIRRYGQKLLPWTCLILAQAVSLYIYPVLSKYAADFPILNQYSQTIQQIIVAEVLVLFNIVLIIIMNFAFASEKEVGEAKVNFEFDTNDMPQIQKDIPAAAVPQIEPQLQLQPQPEEKQALEEITEIVEIQGVKNNIQDDIQDDMPQLHQFRQPEDLFIEEDEEEEELFDFSEEVPVHLSTLESEEEEADTSGEEVFDTIQGLIESGNKEEAIKYLRMVALFGKNTNTMKKAKRILDELQTQE